MQWARNPVPRIHTDNVGMAFVGTCVQPEYTGTIQDCQQFPTPCPELAGATPANKMMGEWYRSNGHNESTASDRNTHEGACSGDWTLGMISDELVLPKDIKAGKYVMSWRWWVTSLLRGLLSMELTLRLSRVAVLFA